MSINHDEMSWYHWQCEAWWLNLQLPPMTMYLQHVARSEQSAMTRLGGAKTLIRALPDSAGCLGSAKCNFLVSHDATVFTGRTQRWRKMLRLRIPAEWAKYNSGLNCQFEPCRAAWLPPQSFFSPGRCFKACLLSQPLVWSGSLLSGGSRQGPGRCCRVRGTWANQRRQERHAPAAAVATLSKGNRQQGTVYRDDTASSSVVSGANAVQEHFLIFDGTLCAEFKIQMVWFQVRTEESKQVSALLMVV